MRSSLFCLLFFTASLVQAAPDVQLFKNQFMFTEKSGKWTRCERVGPRTLRKLAAYKTCEKFSVSAGPTDGTTGKCTKGEGEAAYVYGSRRECKAAREKMPGSHSVEKTQEAEAVQANEPGESPESSKAAEVID